MLRVVVLGAAAGGGVPQWNCGCANCSAVRTGAFSGKPRTQTQVAITADDVHWYLLGASPDLRSQIEATPALHPLPGSRNSPIKGVILTNAELDHVLGLLLLRELQPLTIYSTASVMRILRERNTMFGMLNRVPNQASWRIIASGSTFQLASENGAKHSLCCEVVALADRARQCGPHA